MTGKKPMVLTPFEVAKIESEFAVPDLIERVYDRSQYQLAVKHQRRIGGGLESLWGQGRQLYIVVRRESNI